VHVSKRFPQGSDLLEVPRDVTFDVPSREIVAIIGPSGSGKSTLLNLAAGLLMPDEWRVLVMGDPSDAPLDWSRVGYTFKPYFFSGARLAFGFGWRVSLVAETLGASSGVGYRLRQASDLIQTDQVFAWTITQIAMMLVIEIGLLQPAERYLFGWRRDVRS
jgi:ABC-type cobalamin/Fe3+-siderophores transport system ATPase subunit